MTAGEHFHQIPNSDQIDEDASLMFSIPSQPPDIRNWFSSYEYESPTCSDASTALEDEKNEVFLIDTAEKDSISTKEENLVENRIPSSSEESSQNIFSLESNSFTVEGRRKLLFDRVSALKSISKERTTNTSVTWPNDLHSTNENENYPIIKKEIHENSNNRNNQIEISQIKEAFFMQDDHQLTNRKKSQLIEGMRNIEQKENTEMMAENGFVSTRNRDGVKKFEENSKTECLIASKKRAKFELEDDNGALGKEQTFTLRGVLEEKTNVCLAIEEIETGIAGKWQCPRKNKPYAGPPLKQLRLERWVRRV